MVKLVTFNVNFHIIQEIHLWHNPTQTSFILFTLH